MVVAHLLGGLAVSSVFGQPLTSPAVVRPVFGYTCRMVTANGDVEEATVEVRLATTDVVSDQPAQVTIRRAGAAAFPGMEFPQTVEGTNRTVKGGEPGYVQFAVNGREAAYLVALHVATERNLPAGFFVSRSDHTDWRRNWYWASGFCTSQPENAQ